MRRDSKEPSLGSSFKITCFNSRPPDDLRVIRIFLAALSSKESSFQVDG